MTIQQHTPGPDSTHESDERMVARLWRSYGLALGAVALLTLLSQLAVQTSLFVQADDALVINVAGRQRMLSQKLAQHVLALAAAADADELASQAELLRHTEELWSRSHDALIDGDPELGLPGEPGAELTALYAELEPARRAMTAAAQEALALAQRPFATVAEQMRGPARTVVEHAPIYLETMDAAVGLYEREARSRVDLLRLGEATFLVVTLTVLAIQARFVFRPAVVGIREALQHRRASDSAAHDAARKSAELLGTLNDLILILDGRGRVLSIHAPHGDDVRLRQIEPGRRLLDTAPAELGRVLAPQLEAVMASGLADATVFRMDVGGREHDFESRCARVHSDEVILVVRDVSEQRRFGEELTAAQDRERSRLSRDLHDGVCQHLAGVVLMMRSALPDAEPQDPRLHAELRRILAFLEEALEEARRCSHALHPIGLDSQGLEAVLVGLVAARSRMYAVPCTADVNLDRIEPSLHVATLLYRISEEALSNALKHAGPSRVELTLRFEGEDAVLRVEDDGVGFDPAAVGGGMGLDNLRHRARALGASLSLRPGPSRGTIVECRLSRALLMGAGARDAREGSGGKE